MNANLLVAALASLAAICPPAWSRQEGAERATEEGALELLWERLDSCVGVAADAGLGEIYALERGGECSVFDREGRILRTFSAPFGIGRLAVARFGREDRHGGTVELLGDRTWGHVVVAMSLDGFLRWERTTEDGINHALPADLDADGVDEVVLSFNGSAGFWVLAADGRTVWHDDQLGNVWSVAVANVAGDGRPEVLACFDGVVYVYDADGEASGKIDPGFHATEVAMLGRAANEEYDRLLLAGSRGDHSEIVAAVRSDGEEIWSQPVSASSWALDPEGWVATTSTMRGRVVVLDTSTGKRVASVEGQGIASQLAWLPGDEAILLIATGKDLRAYRLRDGVTAEERREIAHENRARIEARDLERQRQANERLVALRELPPLSAPAGMEDAWQRMERSLAELLPCCPDLPVDASTCANARRALLAEGTTAVPLLVEQLRRSDFTTKRGVYEAYCVESLLVEIVDGRFDHFHLESIDPRSLLHNMEVVHAWYVHAKRAGDGLAYWEDLARRSVRSSELGALTDERTHAGTEPEGIPFRSVGRLMTPGMRIRARTSVGEIEIKAGVGFERHYTWEGATRSARLYPNSGRKGGPLGVGYPGPGDHWAEHEGITRGVLEERRTSFATEADALAWIADQSRWIPYVYRNDGWVVGWRKVLGRRQLNVDVWRIEIAGRTPTKLEGACDECIEIEP